MSFLVGKNGDLPKRLELEEYPVADLKGYIGAASVRLVAHPVLGPKQVTSKLTHEVSASGKEFIHCGQFGGAFDIVKDGGGRPYTASNGDIWMDECHEVL